MNQKMKLIIAIAMMFLSGAVIANAAIIDVRPLLQKLRNVGPKGEGHPQAIAAWKELSQADSAQLPELLAGLDGDCGPLAANWIRSAAESIAANSLRKKEKIPIEALEKFLADSAHSPRARRVAYELIAAVDKTAEERLIPGFLHDTSLELRRDAVALAIQRAEKDSQNAEKEKKIEAYKKAFNASRDLDQIKSVAEKLKSLSAKPDIPTHMGFILKWNVVGPFDNVDKKGFDVAYPPEQSVDLKATYPGKVGKVTWIEFATDDDYGNVDLNKALTRHKGAIAYAFSEFVSDREQDVELRLGCINANKTWLNGQLLSSNAIYHAGQEIDQYVGKGKIKKGRNEILVKIAQNEQTEMWAQDWKFQLRVCDQIGTAILSLDRMVQKTAKR